MNEEVLQALLETKRTCADVAAQCVQAAEARALTRDELVDGLRAYVLAKYHLTQGECASDDMDELSRASMDKMAALGPDAFGEDTASNCDGADSAAVKHAFLMLAIQNDFGVKLDGFAAGRAKVVGDVAGLVYEQLCAMHGGSPS